MLIILYLFIIKVGYYYNVLDKFKKLLKDILIIYFLDLLWFKILIEGNMIIGR